MSKKTNESISVPASEKTKVVVVIKAVLVGGFIGALLWIGLMNHNKEKCIDAIVTIQSFDVCTDRLQGCFFIYEDVLKVGRAIKYKKEYCD